MVLGVAGGVPSDYSTHASEELGDTNEQDFIRYILYSGRRSVLHIGIQLLHEIKSEGRFPRLLRPCYNLLISTPATFERPNRAARSGGQQDAGTTWPQKVAACKIPDTFLGRDCDRPAAWMVSRQESQARGGGAGLAKGHSASLSPCLLQLGCRMLEHPSEWILRECNFFFF